MNALHLLAAARGVPVAESTRCAYCIESPFDAWGDLSTVSESVLAARADPACDILCHGCRSLLAGKPGSQPPPLRMQHVVCAGGAIHYPDRAELRDVITSPPPPPFVVSWATTKKKHHVLHAGISDAVTQRWGSDGGTIHLRPAEHVPVLLAIEALLAAGHARGRVLSGDYQAHAIARQGAAAWTTAEGVVSPYRGRRVLDLLCAIAREERATQTPPAVPLGPLFAVEEDPVTDPIDDLTADIVGLVARGSRRRVDDGLTFWGGYLRSRITRHAHRPLRELVSRLLDDCQVSPSATPDALLVLLDELDAETTHAVETVLRGRAALIVALAFQRRKV